MKTRPELGDDVIPTDPTLRAETVTEVPVTTSPAARAMTDPEVSVKTAVNAPAAQEAPPTALEIPIAPTALDMPAASFEDVKTVPVKSRPVHPMYEDADVTDARPAPVQRPPPVKVAAPRSVTFSGVTGSFSRRSPPKWLLVLLVIALGGVAGIAFMALRGDGTDDNADSIVVRAKRLFDW